MSKKLNLNNKKLGRGTFDKNYLPFGEGLDTCLLQYVVRKDDLQNSSDTVIIGFIVTQTEREKDGVKVGKLYTTSINLDVPGNPNKEGNSAYYAACDLADFIAATQGLTSKEAHQLDEDEDEEALDLNEVFQDLLDKGESVAEEGIEFVIKSVQKHLKDKDTGKPRYREDGSPMIVTNRYYHPVRD